MAVLVGDGWSMEDLRSRSGTGALSRGGSGRRREAVDPETGQSDGDQRQQRGAEGLREHPAVTASCWLLDPAPPPAASFAELTASTPNTTPVATLSIRLRVRFLPVVPNAGLRRPGRAATT
jgi:hypothetical protein